MTIQPDPELLAEVEAIYHGPTAFRDPTRPPAIGTTPPVDQPGRPSMSAKAVDDCVRMIAFGGTTLMMCAGGGIVMVASEFADPTVIGLICAAPAVIAVPILAVARLVQSVGKAEPPVIHQHYNGTVNQRNQTVNSHSRFWGETTNKM